MFAVGEHHRPDFVVSAPAVALAAIAAQTERIRLSSAVTVLSSDDPVRVFQEFAELDLISGGRAEIMAGRGSFIESFPLFGYDLDDYDELYAEKLELLLAIRDGNPVTWSGRHRAGAGGRRDLSRGRCRSRCRSGSRSAARRESVVRAAALGLPLTIAIIGGQPARFKPLVELYDRVWAQAGHDPADRQARDQHARLRRRDAASEADSAFAHSYLAMMNRIGRERGWPPAGRDAVRGADRPARRRRASARRSRWPRRS